MELFEVDKQSCKKDGICAAVCPLCLIAFTQGGYPAPVAEAGEICLQCGHCVTACPEGSLSHRDMPLEQCPPVQTVDSWDQTTIGTQWLGGLY